MMETTQVTWHCRSTSPCCSPSAATAASPSCGSQESSGSGSCWVLWMPTETRKSTGTSTACWLRTPRPITAGYRRWEPTARRVDASTSGCLNWSCRNAEGSGTLMHQQKTGAFWLQMSMKEGSIVARSWDGLEWTGNGLSRPVTSRNRELPSNDNSQEQRPVHKIYFVQKKQIHIQATCLNHQ